MRGSLGAAAGARGRSGPPAAVVQRKSLDPRAGRLARAAQAGEAPKFEGRLCGGRPLAGEYRQRGAGMRRG